MNRLTRRLLALVAIAGGGVVTAAPTALADPPDTTSPSTAPDGVTAASGAAPRTPASAAGPVSPTPASTSAPVLTGRSPAAPTPPPGPNATVDAGGDVGAVHVQVRTGLAVDLARPPAAPGAGTPQETNPARPVAPVPAPINPSPRTPASTPAVGATAADGGTRPTTPGSPAGAPPTPPTSSTYVLVAGDNLWSVAATQLARATGRPAGSVPDAEVTPYWQRLCDTNRSTFRSGDVNLVFPGEQIALPPVGT